MDAATEFPLMQDDEEHVARRQAIVVAQQAWLNEKLRRVGEAAENALLGRREQQTDRLKSVALAKGLATREQLDRMQEQAHLQQEEAQRLREERSRQIELVTRMAEEERVRRIAEDVAKKMVGLVVKPGPTPKDLLHSDITSRDQGNLSPFNSHSSPPNSTGSSSPTTQWQSQCRKRSKEELDPSATRKLRKSTREKQRREALNDKFDELADLLAIPIPTNPIDKKPEKMVILTAAVKLIKELKSRVGNSSAAHQSAQPAQALSRTTTKPQPSPKSPPVQVKIQVKQEEQTDRRNPSSDSVQSSDFNTQMETVKEMGRTGPSFNIPPLTGLSVPLTGLSVQGSAPTGNLSMISLAMAPVPAPKLSPIKQECLQAPINQGYPFMKYPFDSQPQLPLAQPQTCQPSPVQIQVQPVQTPPTIRRYNSSTTDSPHGLTRALGGLTTSNNKNSAVVSCTDLPDLPGAEPDLGLLDFDWDVCEPGDSLGSDPLMLSAPTSQTHLDAMHQTTNHLFKLGGENDVYNSSWMYSYPCLDS